MNPLKSFIEFTKGFNFMEKLVSALLMMIVGLTLYDKMWGDPRKQQANHSTHTMFWGKLEDVRKDNKEFHDAILEMDKDFQEKSLAHQEKQNDRLFDLITAQKRTAVATEKIPEAAAKAAEKIVEDKKAEEEKSNEGF